MKDLNKFTDDMLVTRYSEGDNKAFDELLNRYQSKLFNYIYFIVRSQEMAEDFFQETFSLPFLIFLPCAFLCRFCSFTVRL